MPGVSLWFKGRGRVKGQKARQQLTPRCVCHSACLHGDTIACPSSGCSGATQKPWQTHHCAHCLNPNPCRWLSLKPKHWLRRNRSNRNLKKSPHSKSSLPSINSLSHHPPLPCAQTTAVHEQCNWKSLGEEVKSKTRDRRRKNKINEFHH